jgi:hypothetical protein
MRMGAPWASAQCGMATLAANAPAVRMSTFLRLLDGMGFSIVGGLRVE